jgi:OmpA-OmpF porin, OOP family
MNTILKSMVVASAVLALAACGNVSQQVAKDGTSAGQLVWPAPENTTPMHKGGTFPNVENLRQVRPGLNKQQVSDLIGFPHFSEGVWGVREWNYLFNFRKPGSDEVTVCQFKVLFDDDKLARSFYWQPESCAALLQPPMPAQQTAQVPVAEKHVLSADALFAFDKSSVDDISPDGRIELDALAAQLRSSDAPVRIDGYTDRLGAADYNRQLSERRAQAVKDYLARQGVAAERMHAQGFGEADPVKDCPASPREQLIACLAPNRRVEVKVVDAG